MKNFIIPLMWMIILMGLSSVYAQQTPFAIDGQIVADNPNGLTVRVTNLRSGVTMETTSNWAGQFIVEWANSPGSLKYNISDVFKAEIIDCIDNSKCTQTITYTGQPGLSFSFDLFDVSILTTTPTPTTTIPSCNSCCPSCPTCPDCPVCKDCPTCPTCPKIDYNWLYGGGALIILGIIGTAVGAYKRRVQIRYYKKYFDPIANKWKYKWVILFSRSD